MLSLFAGLIVALLALALAASLIGGSGARARSRARWLTLTMAAIAAAALGLALLAILRGGSTGLVLKTGPSGLRLALDPLSAFFLLPVATVSAAAALWTSAGRERMSPLAPLLLAALLLSLLAADGWSLLLGAGLMLLAGWGLVAAQDAPAARPLLAIGLLGLAGLLAAVALLGDADFATLRAAPPEGARAAAVLLCALLGAGGLAGLAPLHGWLPPALAVLPGGEGAMLGAAIPVTALYLLLRLLFDLCGPQPVWWCLPLLAMSAGAALLGAWRAAVAAELSTALAAAMVGQMGLAGLGLAVALAARGSDLGPLAGLSLSAALLHLLLLALFGALLLLAAGSVRLAAGSSRLAALGGLASRMPVLTGCVLLAGASWAGLPPSAGFASRWLLAQSLLAAPRLGGPGLPGLFALLLALFALSVALAGFAAVRLLGVGFLGRPRTARGSAASDATGRARGALLLLAAPLLLLGLLPGLGLRLAGPILPLLLGPAAELPGGVARLTVAGTQAYQALPLSLGLLALVGTVWLVARRTAPRRVPAWDGGQPAPPPWLPFGDPATQISAEAFAGRLARPLPWVRLRARLRRLARQLRGLATARAP